PSLRCSLLEVITQCGSRAKKGVPDLRAGQRRLDVGEQAQRPWHRSRDRDLTRAQQRDVGEPDLTGAGGREAGGQVGGRGKEDADDILRAELVANKEG